jgi:hypothetical protein
LKIKQLKKLLCPDDWFGNLQVIDYPVCLGSKTYCEKHTCYDYLGVSNPPSFPSGNPPPLLKEDCFKNPPLAKGVAEHREAGGFLLLHSAKFYYQLIDTTKYYQQQNSIFARRRILSAFAHTAY